MCVMDSIPAYLHKTPQANLYLYIYLHLLLYLLINPSLFAQKTTSQFVGVFIYVFLFVFVVVLQDARNGFNPALFAHNTTT